MVHLIKFVSRSEDDTFKFGCLLAGCLMGGDVVALKGKLGSGKSVLARGIMRGLAVSGPIPSPSFITVANYRGRFDVNHIDLYRIESGREIAGLGIEDTIFSDAISIIEWAEKIEELLPGNTIFIHIKPCEERDHRLITLESFDPDVKYRLVTVAVDLLKEHVSATS